jgi:transcriptional regulator with XRE-family HTH domain
MAHDDGSAPEEMLEKDWSALARKYSQAGIHISEFPGEELSGTQIDSIQEAYRSSRGAGEERVRKVLKGVLERRKKSIDQSLESLLNDLEDAEIQNADQRKKPLSEEANRNASRIGLNIDLLREYLSLTFEEMAAVTGLSRSSLNKITRQERMPKTTTLYQLGIGLGLAPVILLSGPKTLQGLDRIASPPALEASSKPNTLEITTDEMCDALYGNPDEGKDPGYWLDEVQSVSVKVADHYQSHGGILGAVIGRHHGGRYGAFLTAYVAHRMRNELRYGDLDGFRFPSEFVWGRIEWRMREAGTTMRS